MPRLSLGSSLPSGSEHRCLPFQGRDLSEETQEPFLRLHFNYIQSFVSKVVSQFHLNQVMYLPVFFPEVHSSPEQQRLYARCRLVFSFVLHLTYLYPRKGQDCIRDSIGYASSTDVGAFDENAGNIGGIPQ